MPKKEQLDHLQRLVHLISDDNELLSHANDFMQRLVNTKYDALGAQDISAQLAAAEKKKGGETPVMEENPHQTPPNEEKS